MNIKNLCITTICLALASLVLTTTQAKEIESVIVTATRTTSEAEKHPEIFQVSNEVLNQIQSQHIQDVLINTPGVNIQRGNGQEYLPAIRSQVFTGAGSCGAILTAEDGIPLRSAGFCNVNELFEAHTEIAQNIEVLRGTATSLYGSNALHGLINVITPNPQDTQNSIGLELGSDAYQRVKLSNTWGTAKNFASHLSITRDGGFRDESGFDQQKLNLRYQEDVGNKSISAGFSATNLNQETAGFITGLDAFEDDSLVTSNPTPEGFRDVQSTRAWLRYSQEITNNSSLVITPYVRDTDMTFLQHFLPGDPLEENGQTSIGVQSAFYTSLNSNIDIVTGLDAESTDAFLKQSQDAPTQGSAFLMATIPSGVHYDYEVDAKTLAAFVYGDWQANSKLSVISGLRYETIDYDYDNLSLDGRTRDDGTACGFGGCRYSRPADRSDSFDNLSSHISFNYALSPTISTYLKWSQGFRVPQATELYRLQRAQTEADLESETLKGFEIGSNISLENLNANIAIYNQKKDNFIFRDSDFFNVSNGETSHQGLEVFADYQFTTNWNIVLNANLAKHTYDNEQISGGVNIDGNDIDTAPRRFGSLSLNWQALENLSTQLQWSHTGSYYLNPENTSEYSGHNLLHLRTQWQYSPKWNFSVRLNNLLDENYAERADFTSFTQERYFPGRERSFFLSLNRVW